EDRPHPLAPKSPSSGRPGRFKLILIAGTALAALVLIGIIAAELLLPRANVPAPQIVDVPPLPQVTRNSIIMAPVSIPLSAIRDAAERAAPRNFAGKADNPAAQVLQNADINWTAARGAIAVTGAQDALSLAAPLSGKINATGSLSAKVTGAVGDAIGNLLGADAAQKIGGINIKNINANAEIKGNVVITTRPRFAANWHLEPNFAAQVNLGDTTMSVSGMRLNVPAQIKPVIDKAVNDQMNALSEKVRNDPSLMRSAQAQWGRACRSVPLQGPGLPAVWLEVKPTRVLAAQPKVDANTITITMGIEAETRVTPAETRPDCPFPDKITVIPPTTGGLNVAVPIDVPFTELNKLVDSQLAGRTFPEDGSGPVAVTVNHASVTPSGDRLLISLQVRAKEKSSFLGLGAEATIHIWGRPLVDQAAQTLQLTDLQLAVESDAAFGLLGTAARAVVPQLQRALLEKSVIDLKPFSDNARARIAASMSEFRRNDNGIRIDTDVSSLTLTEIAFDSNVLRIIASAEGTMNASITTLPGL
ncbi:MAG: DUF4403 family protein, partial [Tardiphaga sp.]